MSLTVGDRIPLSAAKGNAEAGDVLQGKTFSSATAGIDIEGTIMDRTALHSTPEAARMDYGIIQVAPREGYYGPYDPQDPWAVPTIYAVDNNIRSYNIKEGVTILGYTGTLSPGETYKYFELSEEKADNDTDWTTIVDTGGPGVLYALMMQSGWSNEGMTVELTLDGEVFTFALSNGWLFLHPQMSTTTNIRLAMTHLHFKTELKVKYKATNAEDGGTTKTCKVRFGLSTTQLII